MKQRKTTNLGINHSKDKEKYYLMLEKNGISTKHCSRANPKNKNSQYNIVHEGKPVLPIREFNLLPSKAKNVLKSGKKLTAGNSLQAYCIVCERKYRRGRLDKWSNYYSEYTDEQIYIHYAVLSIYNLSPNNPKAKQLTKKYIEEQIDIDFENIKSFCSIEKEDIADPRNFSISRKMDKGLHNVCNICSKSYTESVGERWIIFSPDGRNSLNKKNTVCNTCGKKSNIHKDHIWPLAKGGTDWPENIQFLCDDCNLSKSATISLGDINQVKPEMICERYRMLLTHAIKNGQSIKTFESEISKSVIEFLILKRDMSDFDLEKFFQNEKKRNNRNHSVERAVKKYREFTKKRNLETRLLDYLS